MISRREPLIWVHCKRRLTIFPWNTLRIIHINVSIINPEYVPLPYSLPTVLGALDFILVMIYETLSALYIHFRENEKATKAKLYVD